MLLKVATPFTTVEVILEGIEKVIVLLSDAPIHTRPAARVNEEVLDVVFTVKLICALAFPR